MTKEKPIKHDYSDQIKFYYESWLQDYIDNPEELARRTNEHRSAYHQELQWLEDYYMTALEQTPRLTICYHQDGTDEALSQAFFQTRLPDSKFARFVLKMKARIEEAKYAFEVMPDIKQIITDPEYREEFLSYLFNFDTACYYAFATLTECEAEIQCNLEAHMIYALYHVDNPYRSDFKYIPVRFFNQFDYPPINERYYHA